MPFQSGGRCSARNARTCAGTPRPRAGSRRPSVDVIVKSMTDAPWQTIPELIDDACRRFAELRGARRRRRAPDFTELGATGSTTRRAALMARGVANGRPGRDLGAEHLGVARRRAGGALRRRGGWSRSTRASRAARPAYVLQHSRRRSCCSRSPTSSTPTTSALLRGRRARLPDLERDRRAARARSPDGTIALGRLPRRGAGGVDAADAAPQRSDAVQPATTSATSSSRRARPARPRARCSSTRRSCKAYRRVGRRGRAARRATATSSSTRSSTPFGLQGSGILACLMQGRDHPPAPGVRRARGDAPRRRGAHHACCPGPPAIYQTILNHPDRRRVRPVVAAARGHRRGRDPGRADPADARASSASRRSSPATASPRRTGIATMCRHDDDPETIARHVGPGDPRHRGAGRRRRRQRGAARRARRDRGPRLQRDERLPRRPRGRPPRRSTPTAGCTPATSA